MKLDEFRRVYIDLLIKDGDSIEEIMKYVILTGDDYRNAVQRLQQRTEAKVVLKIIGSNDPVKELTYLSQLKIAEIKPLLSVEIQLLLTNHKKNYTLFYELNASLEYYESILDFFYR
jgi:hypothetical protein